MLKLLYISFILLLHTLWFFLVKSYRNCEATSTWTSEPTYAHVYLRI